MVHTWSMIHFLEILDADHIAQRGSEMLEPHG